MFLPVMDSVIQYSIFSTVTSIVITTITSAQTRHKKEIFALYRMIEKTLLLRESGFSTPFSNSNASSKGFLPADLSSKVIKKWNQIDLAYFNPHLDRAYRKGKVVSIDKDVYYKNVVLFI